MAISIENWVKQAHIDYTAGRYNGTRPVTTLVYSKPGEAKSTFIETVLLDTLERRLFAGEQADVSDRPGVLRGSHVHFSRNGTVACLTDLAAMRDAPDYKGFLVPKKDGTSAYTMADLVSMERKLYELGVRLVVLFLDEMLQADHLTQKALTDVCLNGRFGSYSLRPETWVIAASNRTKDGAGVNRALTILTNRINVIEVFLPVETWTAYASTLELPPLTISFAKQMPGKISIDQPPKEGPFPSWRSYTYAAQWLKAYKEAMSDADPMRLPFERGDAYVTGKVAGFIGEGLTVELAAYARVANELPTIDEIRRSPSTARLPAAGRLDAAYAAAQMIVHYAAEENIETLWEYAERLPLELQAATARDMLKKQGPAMMHESERMAKWISRNGDVIRASTSN